MNKQSIKQWLVSKGHEFTGTIRSNDTYGNPDYLINLINQCFTELQPQWVSVDDRLPDRNECIDIWGHLSAGYNQGDESRICDVFYNHTNNYWWHYNDDQVVQIVKGFNVTHWQSLPLPPSEGE